MFVSIITRGRLDVQVSPALRDLGGNLEEAGLKPEINTLTVPSMKADLVVGLTIATLAVNAVSALIAVVVLWQSRQRTYSVSITSNGRTYEVSGLKKADVEKIAREIVASGEEESISIILS